MSTNSSITSLPTESTTFFLLVSLVKIPAFAGVSPCGRQISRRNKPRRGDTGKPRAQALGSGSPSQGALKGRRRAHCQYALFRPFRAPQLLLSFPGLAPWAVLRRPFGARGRCACPSNEHFSCAVVHPRGHEELLLKFRLPRN